MGAPLRDDLAPQLLANLVRYAGHPDARCFVDVVDGTVVSFVTCAALRHPIEPAVKGEVEELFVLPGRERLAIKAALVRAAVLALQGLGAHSIHVTTSTDREDAPAQAFWRRQGWEQGMTIFSIYADLPGDPVLQAVWQRYTPEG
ncbi:MAG TPA: GNAT family N-acetyltransferase [Chloroflexaceae bacterium]|nr:GNAT family N-acetyltransferase [Chloroflexaceae bacterium]